MRPLLHARGCWLTSRAVCVWGGGLPSGPGPDTEQPFSGRAVPRQRAVHGRARYEAKACTKLPLLRVRSGAHDMT